MSTFSACFRGRHEHERAEGLAGFRGLLEATSVQEATAHVAAIASASVGADLAAVFLRVDGEPRLRLVAGDGCPAGLVGTLELALGAPAALALELRAPVLSTEGEALGAWATDPLLEALTSWVATPMPHIGETIGALAGRAPRRTGARRDRGRAVQQHRGPGGRGRRPAARGRGGRPPPAGGRGARSDRARAHLDARPRGGAPAHHRPRPRAGRRRLRVHRAAGGRRPGGRHRRRLRRPHGRRNGPADGARAGPRRARPQHRRALRHRALPRRPARVAGAGRGHRGRGSGRRSRAAAALPRADHRGPGRGHPDPAHLDRRGSARARQAGGPGGGGHRECAPARGGARARGAAADAEPGQPGGVRVARPRRGPRRHRARRHGALRHPGVDLDGRCYGAGGGVARLLGSPAARGLRCAASRSTRAWWAGSPPTAR